MLDCCSTKRGKLGLYLALCARRILDMRCFISPVRLSCFPSSFEHTAPAFYAAFHVGLYDGHIFASHSEAMASAAELSRACSLSTSFWCIRSDMLSDEA